MLIHLLSLELSITESTSHSVSSTVRKILRPLIRFLLRQQITYPMICHWLKETYVDIADREFSLDNKAQSDSRVSLLTGIHRKEVKRLRETITGNDEIPQSVSLGASLVATWLGTPRYQDEHGRPAPLPRFSKEDDGPSFEELITSNTKDIRPRVILDELLRLGVCQVDDDNRVYLLEESFIPEKGFEEKLFFLGKNVHDHLAASIHNMQITGSPFLERSVYYDELTKADTDMLAAYTRDIGSEILRKTNQKAMQLQESSKNNSDANYRMNFGIYFYSEFDAEHSDNRNEDEI